MIRYLAFFAVTALCAPLAASHEPLNDDNAHVYHVARCYPHDMSAFTQGLFYENGALYESTGRVGQSSLRRVRLTDGVVEQSANIEPPFFGEGSTVWDDEIISLTWRAGVGMRWDRDTFRLKSTFRYRGEGWGLTQDGKNLIMSDGTPVLRFLDPKNFSEQRLLEVTENGMALANLNELEWVDGQIYANVWMSDRIVRIDPDSGKVLGSIGLADIARKVLIYERDDVLNGIAYDKAGKRLFVTGKKWPLLFELKRGLAPEGFTPDCSAMPDAAID